MPSYLSNAGIVTSVEGFAYLTLNKDSMVNECESDVQLGRGGKSDWQILRSAKQECRISCSKPLLFLSHWYAVLLRLTQHCCQ